MNECLNFMQAPYLTENQILSPLASSSLLFSGLMHDIDHPGWSNMFEINSQSELSIIYNDSSVLENHHSATAFKLLASQKTNIFSSLGREEFMFFRKSVITGILATDIKNHFVVIKKIEGKIKDDFFYPSSMGEDEQCIEDYYLLLKLLTHTADLYIPTLCLETSLKWTQMVNLEFMQ